MATDSLIDLDAAMLAIEDEWWPTAGAKEDAIRVVLGMKPSRYYQRLNRLLDAEAAVVHNPVTVNRLNRLRSAKSGPRLSL
ncbi:MAG: hypothetical protein JWR78_897 [Mycobacterium sp.]|nr:hypothetical protein [Mycobacterium sp.]